MGLGAKKDEKPVETPPSSARAESVVTKTLSPILLATVVLEGEILKIIFGIKKYFVYVSYVMYKLNYNFIVF